MSLGHIVKKIWPGQSFHIIWVKGQGHSDLVLVHDTPAHQDASLYIYIYIYMYNIALLCRSYSPDTVFLLYRSKVKVTVT